MGLYLLFISILTCVGIFIYTVVNSGYPLYRNMGIIIVVLAGAISCAFVVETGHFNNFRELMTALLLMVTCLGAISVSAYIFTSKHLQKLKKNQTASMEQPIQPRKKEYRDEEPTLIPAKQDANRNPITITAVTTQRNTAPSPQSVDLSLIQVNAVPEHQQASRTISEVSAETEAKRLVPVRQTGVNLEKEPEIPVDRRADREQKPSIVIKRTELTLKPATQERTGAAAKKQTDKPAAEASDADVRQNFADLLEREKKRLEAEVPAELAQPNVSEKSVVNQKERLIVKETTEQQETRKAERSADAQAEETVSVLSGIAVEDVLPKPVKLQTPEVKPVQPAVHEAPVAKHEAVAPKCEFTVPEEPKTVKQDQPEQDLPDPSVPAKDFIEQQTEPVVVQEAQPIVVESPKEPEPPAEPVVSKQEAVLIKAVSLAEQSRYLLAMQLLLSVSFSGERADVQKRANLLILECMIETTDFAGAQKKLFDILNARYAFDEKEKVKLKDMMLVLKTVGGGQSA